MATSIQRAGESDINTKRALVAGGILAALGVGVGIAVAVAKPAAAAPPPPNPSPNPTPPPGVQTWSVVSPTNGVYTLGAGQYRFSVDDLDPTLPPNSAAYVAREAFAFTVPAQQDNQLVTYDLPGGPALPADWPATDRAANRTRSSFIIPAGSGQAAIPDSYNVKIWALT